MLSGALATVCGCLLSQHTTEVLISADKGAGIVFTLLYFIAFAVDGLIDQLTNHASETKETTSNGKGGKGKGGSESSDDAASGSWLRKRVIPLRRHIGMVCLYFAMAVCTNGAFRFGVPITVHTVFRSSSLATNLVLGRLLLGRRYTVLHVLAVAALSIGIFVVTGHQHPTASSSSSSSAAAAGGDASLWTSLALQDGQIVGVLLLLAASVSSSILNVVEEQTYRIYGAAPREAMFYRHVLSLPLFAVFAHDIADHMLLLWHHGPVDVALVPATPLPVWSVLVLSTVFQYCCVRAVFHLLAMSSSLTVTVVVTVRKILSILFSVYFFSTPLTSWQVVGIAMVFGGALVYALAERYWPSKKKKEKEQ